MQQRVESSGAPEHLGRFTFAPPRHFVLPAVLLLLSEEPSHGYELVKALRAFRFGDVDRPAVYRALGQLEKDGLVESWSAESKAGQARRVYDLTAEGRHALRAWMGILKEERDGLDRVLRRYRAMAFSHQPATPARRARPLPRRRRSKPAPAIPRSSCWRE